jgi:NADH-quinone oxidoreductase subunit A
VAVTPIAVVAYLLLFMGVGVVFLFVTLLLGRFLRPSNPTPQKSEIYECGEIAVGPSFLQYDLRFYVVALLFIIFEVEVALFFPPAVVFGKVNQLRSQVPNMITASSLPSTASSASHKEGAVNPSDEVRQSLGDLGIAESPKGKLPPVSAFSEPLQKLALAIIVDLGLFFAVLMVGFAYLWYRGDIAWIRTGGVRRGATG